MKRDGFGGLRFRLDDGGRVVPAGGAARAKSPARQRGGAAAERLGKLFEAVIDRHLERARDDLAILSWFEPTQALFRAVRGGAFVPVERGMADRVGMLRRPRGLALALEVKSRADVLYKSEVTERQQEHLDATARDGGLALLVVELREAGRPPAHFALPWLQVPWRVRESAPSLAVADLAGLDWEMAEPCLLARFV